MRYYVTINNKNSLELTGLYISKLPDISKPSKRATIEEIDGRDGDIITTLGYSAYDKELEIGLFGLYDLDEIITFFNQDGIITFSNEPDKYYKFSLLNKIDFEELLKFRKAKITFHCQPFKFSTIEEKKIFNNLSENELSIKNNGNVYSKPIITITGDGTINLSLNEEEVIVLTLDNETIEIDTDKLEAYNPLTKVLMNRKATGNYENLYLKKGINTISWTGTISEIDIKNYSRWI